MTRYMTVIGLSILAFSFPLNADAKSGMGGGRALTQNTTDADLKAAADCKAKWDGMPKGAQKNFNNQFKAYQSAGCK